MSAEVLYISYDGMTDPLGQSQVIPYLEGLSKLGYKITLISFEKPERVSKNKPGIHKTLQQANIDWHPLPYTKHPPVLSTIYDLWRMKKLAQKLHRQKNFHLVHCRSYISALVGRYLKRIFGIGFLFDMRGFYADERVDGKIWNLKNPVYKLVYRFFKNAEQSFLQEADCTISLTHAGKKEIQSWSQLKGQPLPIEVIPCCADVNHFSQKNVDAHKATQLKNELKSDFVLCYVGSMGTWYMPNEMFDFFNVLVTYKSDALFLILTADEPEHIYRLSESKGIVRDKLIVKESSRKDLPTYLSVCQLSVFFIKPVFSKKASSPTKHGELMSMGIPLVANDFVGDVGDIIRHTKSGVVISDFAAQSYRTAIETVLNTTYNQPQISQCAREVYGLENGIKTYDTVYRFVLQNKTHRP
ncbi:MAG: glycosyltransferase [Chitinophagales bacterium]|nr:glycosyltransferase [Chitinophagales bacterium]